MHLFSNLHELATVLGVHLIIYIGFPKERQGLEEIGAIFHRMITKC